METGEARRALAAALTREAVLAEEESTIEDMVASARRRDEVFDRESFAAWLASMTEKRAGLARTRSAAAAETATARRMLANRTMAETAVEDALALARANWLKAEAHRDQAMLEDAARAIRRD